MNHPPTHGPYTMEAARIYKCSPYDVTHIMRRIGRNSLHKRLFDEGSLDSPDYPRKDGSWISYDECPPYDMKLTWLTSSNPFDILFNWIATIGKKLFK